LRKSGCSAGEEKDAKQGSNKPFVVCHHGIGSSSQL
jgi:hypothetical protein